MMGFGTIAKKVFGTPNDRKVKATRPLVAAINALEPEFKALDDAGLKAKTVEFRERVAKGATLEDLLPEAFANAREAARRTLGLRPFDVQLMGGIFLHQGNISEMKTGEGKTLVATMPAYLNALTGRGVHVVTVNDYLAKRDAEWMGLVYHALGMSVGVVVPNMPEDQKKVAYDADGHAEGVVDEAHPVGVALREVVVDRHHVHAATGQGVEVDRQRRHQGLALAGLHLGDVALVEEDAAHQLDVEGAQAEGAAGRLAGVGEGLGEEVVEGLALGEALPELGSLGAEPFVVEGAERGLERVDLLDEGADGLDFAVVRRSEHLLRDRSQSQHEQTSSNLKGVSGDLPPTRSAHRFVMRRALVRRH